MKYLFLSLFLTGCAIDNFSDSHQLFEFEQHAEEQLIQRENCVHVTEGAVIKIFEKDVLSEDMIKKIIEGCYAAFPPVKMPQACETGKYRNEEVK